MQEQDSETRVISLGLFNALLDHYLDFCRKLRFFVKGGFNVQEESLALEVILEHVEQKERDLEQLRKRAIEECKQHGMSTESMETMIGRFLMQNEDYLYLQRIADIRKNGGSQWDILNSIIQGTYRVAPKKD